jgi:hypothetical protein
MASYPSAYFDADLGGAIAPVTTFVVLRSIAAQGMIAWRKTLSPVRGAGIRTRAYLALPIQLQSDDFPSEVEFFNYENS